MVITTPLRLLSYCVALLISVHAASATTYYIDYASGSDSNSGTSKSSPWKRCPGMAGAAQNYSHSAGDRFIFKGGVTWPRSCFRMRIVGGGSSDSNRDYYGVDQSWFSGSSWRRPKFDFERVLIGTYQNGAGVYVENLSNITFDNLELANHRQPPDTSSGPAGQGSSVITLWGNVNNITVQNCYIHDWDIALPVNPPSTLDGGSSGAIYRYSTGSGGGSNLKALNNLITQEGIACRSGNAFKNIGEVAYNEVRYVHTILLGGGKIHDNHFHHLQGASDPTAHENTLYMNSPGSVYNNLIHDVEEPGNQIIYCEPGFSASSGTLMVYNNVVFDGRGSGSHNGCIIVDPEGAHAEATAVKIFNNTLQHAGQTIRIAARPGKRTGLVELGNNHHIGSGVTREANSTISFIDHGTDVVQSLSTAAGFGATPTNGFKPTSSNAPTKDKGTSLAGILTTDINGVSRGYGAGWDVGAYEYNGTSGGSLPTPAPTPPPTPTPVPTSTPTATPSSSPSPTPAATSTPVANPTATPTSSPAVLGLSFNAKDGIITPPFVVAAGGIAQPIQTTDPSLGGRAVYSVNVDSAGDYGIAADVNCPSEGNNSFFVSIDGEPTAPLAIWDVAVTQGSQQRLVSWRGTGSDSDNQFAPKIFNLSAGVHQVIVRGREGGAELVRMSLVKIPSPPSNLTLNP